jgi:spore germination protein YaaH
MIEKIKQNLNLISCFILFALIISLSAFSYAQYVSNNEPLTDKSQPFSDVPADSYAYGAIHELRKMGITNGIGNNNFGYGQTMTRGEFITLLINLLDIDAQIPVSGSFTDNQDPKKYYFAPVEAALRQGIISDENDTFRPRDPITREEAVVMIINGLGYKDLAERIYYIDNSFEDVSNNKGHITIAEDFGIISTASAFGPSGNILREQAAAMLIRMIDAMDRRIDSLNGFYAISSSSQKDKIKDLSSVCFGWSRLSYDTKNQNVILNMSNNSLGFNEFYLPVGFNDRLSAAKDAGVPAFLMVYASRDISITDPATGQNYDILEYVLERPDIYSKVISDITAALKEVSRDGEVGSFDGVVIDFEGLRGDQLKSSFNSFLKELKSALDRDGKKLYVAVHPLIHPKRSAVSIDGYDYRTIGALADKVILMAHDYDAKKLTKSEMERGINITPLTPIEDIYYALRAVTDKQTGVQDKSRIMLQISFDWTVWQQKDSRTVNSIPLSFNLENFMKLLESDTEKIFNYHTDYENPYLKYADTNKGTQNTVWYENSRSVMAKTRLARFFGIQGISLWRLGLIPDYQDEDNKYFDMDVWQSLLGEMEQKEFVQNEATEQN